MTSTSRRPPSDRSGADPWWGFDDPAPGATISFDEPSAATMRTSRDVAAPARRRRERQGGITRIGWLLLGLVLAPFDLVRRLLARSPRLRSWAIRFAVVLAILTVLACSVGVILINNVVIGRSAELGELDDRRRELRRDNALLSAQAARLSSPDVVFRRATRELGMVPTDDVPQFIYLVPGSRTLTPLQRQRVAARVQRQRAAAATAAAAKRDADTARAAATDGAPATAAKEDR